MKNTKSFQERFNRWKNGENYWDIVGKPLRELKPEKETIDQAERDYLDSVVALYEGGKDNLMGYNIQPSAINKDGHLKNEVKVDLPEIIVRPNAIHRLDKLQHEENEFARILSLSEMWNGKPNIYAHQGLGLSSPEFDVISVSPIAKQLFTPALVNFLNTVSNFIKTLKLLANSNLYSDNPFVNYYATMARRYNLPDKARLPYLIRRVKSDYLNLDGNEIILNGNRFGHTNFTYDRLVVPHKKGSWDAAELTLLINPRNLVKQNKWGSIEPSDMFNIQNPVGGLRVSNKDVVIISGNPNILTNAFNNNMKLITSNKLNKLEQHLLNIENLANKANSKSRFGLEKNERVLPNRDYWNEVFKLQQKFGRPKVKDVRLLENVTGMKSGISNIQDINRFKSLSYENIKNTNINNIRKVLDRMPHYGNGRQFDGLNWHEYNGITYPYKNFFYDPATHAESKFKFNIH